MMFAVAGNAIVAGTTVVGARYFAMFLVRSPESLGQPLPYTAC